MPDNMNRLKSDWEKENPKQQKSDIFYQLNQLFPRFLQFEQIPLINTSVSASE